MRSAAKKAGLWSDDPKQLRIALEPEAAALQIISYYRKKGTFELHPGSVNSSELCW